MGEWNCLIFLWLTKIALLFIKWANDYVRSSKLKVKNLFKRFHVFSSFLLTFCNVKLLSTAVLCRWMKEETWNSPFWFIDLHLPSVFMSLQKKKRGRRVEFSESGKDEPNRNPFTFHWKMEMVEDELQNFKSLSHKVFQAFFFISPFFYPQLQSAHFRISIELKREEKGFRSTFRILHRKGWKWKKLAKIFPSNVCMKIPFHVSRVGRR